MKFDQMFYFVALCTLAIGWFLYFKGEVIRSKYNLPSENNNNVVYAIGYLTYTIIVGLGSFFFLNLLGLGMEFKIGIILRIIIYVLTIIIVIIIVLASKFSTSYKQELNLLICQGSKPTYKSDKGKIWIAVVILALISGLFTGGICYVVNEEYLVEGIKGMETEITYRFSLVIMLLIVLYINALLLIAKIQCYYEIFNLKEQTIFIKNDVYNTIIVREKEDVRAQKYIKIQGSILKYENCFITILVIGKGIISVNENHISSIYTNPDIIRCE